MPFHVPAELLGSEKEQPRAPCVVTLAYLCRVYQLVEGVAESDETSMKNYLFEDIGERARDLVVQAGCAGGSEDLQKLRGFFCMGVLLQSCLGPVLTRRSIVITQTDVLPPRPTHGWEDLSKIILRTRRLHEDFVIDGVERQLRGMSSRKRLDPQIKEVIDAVAQAALVLRRSLRAHTKLNGVRMGRLLANAQHSAGVTADKMLDVVPHLLRVTEESAWLVKSSLESPLPSSARP